MPQQLFNTLDEALGATMTRDELTRFTRTELGRRHAFSDNVSQGTYPSQRVEYISYLDRQGKLREFTKLFLEYMVDNGRVEITALKIAFNEPANQPPVSPTPASPTPPPSGTDIVKQVREFVGNSNLRQALDTLEANANGDSNLVTTVILLKGQLSRLEKDSLMGIITNSEGGIRRTRIANGILGLLR